MSVSRWWAGPPWFSPENVCFFLSDGNSACSDGSRPVGGKMLPAEHGEAARARCKIKAQPKLLSCASLAVLSRSGHVIPLSPPPSHPPPASFNLFRPFLGFCARAAAAGMNLVQSCFEKSSLISTRGVGRTFCCPYLLFEAAGWCMQMKGVT